MRLSDLTPARRAELLARYPTEPNAGLRAEFDLTQNQLSLVARQGNVKKTKATVSKINSQPRNIDSIGKRIYNAIGAAGQAGLAAQGVLTALPGTTAERVQATLYNLTTRGSLFRAGERGRGRWFTRKEWASDHEVRLLAESAARARASCTRGVSIKHHTAPAHLPGDAIVPAGVHPVECPSVPGPAERLAACEPGLFSNLGPGQYVDAQPRNWVHAITSRPTVRSAA